MAIAMVPKRPATIPADEQEKERRAEAFIAGGGSAPEPETRKRPKKEPVTMKWDPELLGRVDRAAKRKGINRTAWVHFKLSELLDLEEG